VSYARRSTTYNIFLNFFYSINYLSYFVNIISIYVRIQFLFTFIIFHMSRYYHFYKLAYDLVFPYIVSGLLGYPCYHVTFLCIYIYIYIYIYIKKIHNKIFFRCIQCRISWAGTSLGKTRTILFRQFLPPPHSSFMHLHKYLIFKNTFQQKVHGFFSLISELYNSYFL